MEGIQSSSLDRRYSVTPPPASMNQTSQPIQTAPLQSSYQQDSQIHNMNSESQREPPGVPLPLLQEAHRLRKLVAELETRTTQLELQYMDFAAIEEPEQMLQLREYKHHKEKEMADFERKVRSLSKLNEEQEQHLMKLSAQVEEKTAEIEQWNHTQSNQPSQYKTDVSRLADQVTYAKKKVQMSQDEAKKLYGDNKILRTLISSPKTDPLESKMAITEWYSGVKVLEHAAKSKSDTFVCQQQGNNGSVQYKLEISKEGGSVRYTPLVLESVDPQFLPQLQDLVEFESNLLHTFFWRLNTYLNKKVTSS